MDRHCATRRLRRLAQVAGVHAARMHPHMLRHTIVTTMLDAGVVLQGCDILKFALEVCRQRRQALATRVVVSAGQRLVAG
jgi:integrase